MAIQSVHFAFVEKLLSFHELFSPSHEVVATLGTLELDVEKLFFFSPKFVLKINSSISHVVDDF